MLKTIAWKELRELLPLSISIFIIEIYLILGAHHDVFSSQSARERIETAWTFLFVLGLAFPMILGLWHGARESQQNTYTFLLHRPIRRELIFGVKLFVGACICLLLAALPIGWYSSWAVHMNGRSYMWEFAKPLCAGILLLYFGAFLSMLRPARTMGSQFFPLLGAIFLFLLLFISSAIVLDVNTLDSWRTLAPNGRQVLVLSIGILVEVGFVIAILAVGNTRDYS
jgi:hypothetical protein